MEELAPSHEIVQNLEIEELAEILPLENSW